ncbi:hypothetical protein FW781_06930 (plasmid) [Chryseobacterium panacisoli]|uniref:Uncharacterized protein n=1 Tax=Chryseobacterium panacisoli TaxID=1807141 RepID=A0A5D8ZZ88_9FLAO|nr:hypothetical protein [Chryseobacterium panacisoli]TZF99656.1 hypothetical protein FW781_06930 [Chryseobacterium panacisoli]
MILGVYWCFKFPDHLYDFTFFKFYPGYGGHADNPAELAARVQVENITDFLIKLEKLKTNFRQTHVQVNINGNQLIINIGDYLLFDYHFQLATEIEELLIRENALLLDSSIPFIIQFNKSYPPERDEFKSIEHRFIQMVGSDFKKNNAENYMVRIDCNLPLQHKQNLIHDLVQICQEENLNVFYYHDSDFNEHCNLMLFFSNGRQKKENIQQVDINSFGSKVRLLTQKYSLHFGHFGSFKEYPLQGPHVSLMLDKEYIVNKK